MNYDDIFLFIRINQQAEQKKKSGFFELRWSDVQPG